MFSWITRKNILAVVALPLFAIIAAGWFVFNGEDTSSNPLPDVVDFNQHIRPILSTNCYVCHGPDISTREAGLRLDLRDSALVVLESGVAAVVPGDHEESELIRRVSTSNEDDRMPPAEVKKTLSEYEIGLLKRWIDQGAEWKKHWAFEPVSAPVPPSVFKKKYIDNDIDRFIVSRLEDEGIKPASKASKESLIRRLSFVLTGLPPTPEGVEAFVNDKSPEAYEKLVDRLLDSPQFGERWARHWMDVVRYADTKGHEFDYPVVGAWQYRDYLIRAFNDDIPYDQLLKEHLAGDLINEPRMHSEEGFNESLLGTAFFALGEGTHSPVDLVIDESERINNIIDVTSKTFQGLTVSCAKCHDHKFDPIPTADYYSWYGIIKSTRFGLHAANEDAQAKTLISDVKSLNTKITQGVADQWEQDIKGISTPVVVQVERVLPELSEALAQYGDSMIAQPLGDFRAGSFGDWTTSGSAFGENPVMGDLQLNEQNEIVSLGTSRASSAGVSKKLIGSLRSPDFRIDHDYITVRAAGFKSVMRIVIDNFQLIRFPIYGDLEKEVEGEALRDYQFDVAMWKGHPAYIEFLPAWDRGENFFADDTSYIDIEYAFAHNGALKDISLSPPQQGIQSVDSTTAHSALSRWRAHEATAQDVYLLNGLLEKGLLSSTIPDLAPVIEEKLESKDNIPDPSLIWGVVDGDGTDHPVFVRGNVQDPSEERVPRRALTIYNEGQTPFEGEGSGRLDWASSMADASNPLTSRVMANRLWHHVFGRGLVETVDNFGIQGKMPTHPQLLDYLASRFVEQGWSVKALIRDMVLSQAFQRTVEASEESLEKDPQNLLLQHYPTRRLEAEAIRDAMLSVSGRLNTTMYGEGVPVYLSPFMTGRGRPRESGPLDGDGRRSIYISLRRNFLPPMMLAFDMPIPFTTFGKRNTSTVPAQSLTLLNDPFVENQAEHWAKELISLKELDARERIEVMYNTAFSRSAKEEEIVDGLAFLETQAATYGLDVDDWANDTRPWKDYCHALFNMKEFIHLI